MHRIASGLGAVVFEVEETAYCSFSCDFLFETTIGGVEIPQEEKKPAG